MRNKKAKAIRKVLIKLSPTGQIDKSVYKVTKENVKGIPIKTLTKGVL